jgi:hypothetical protein
LAPARAVHARDSVHFVHGCHRRVKSFTMQQRRAVDGAMGKDR